MTEREKFLERWSRKKIDAKRDASAGQNAAPEGKDIPVPEKSGPSEHGAELEAKASANAAPKLEFDLASLPSLDSITASTDIRAFLTPGVPNELARAALRRAWSADPAIRNFVGLAENAWDFTDPTAMPGFGALPPGTDIKKMLAQIFGEVEKPAAMDAADAPKENRSASEAPGIAAQTALPQPPVEAALGPREKAEPRASEVATGGQQSAQDDFVQRDNNTAMHNDDSESEAPKSRRYHGGALPQ